MNRLGFHLIGKPNEDFESCSDCIHADDSEEICTLRKCVHAIKYLYDCYEKAGQKTGKWIHDGKDFPHGNDWIHCSVCGKRGINVPADLTNYCPDCGARMEWEKE